MIKNILFPLDFSEPCRAAWPAVVDFARQMDVPVTVLHALQLERVEAPNAPPAYDAIRRHFLHLLEQWPDGQREPPNLRRELVEGHAANCIVQRAAAMEAPLIMMPTRGQTRFRQLLLGSVTASVLHDAACPVWTAAHVDSLQPRAGVIDSMVCAIDMGPQTPHVLQAAHEFSKLLGASLHVIHSVPGVDPRFPSAVADRAHSLLIDRALEDFPVYCQEAGLNLTLQIVEDAGLVDGILKAAASHAADLLVIGRGVIKGPLGRLRTNAHQLIRESPCPVLSV
jgi:nucleotide-binding universal stress UspA family protein